MNMIKMKKALTHFENYLVVHKTVSPETARGYSRALSIALRRMRKFIPSYDNIIEHIMWLRNSDYSYSHITNTMLSLEHYMELKGNPIKLSRPRKPKRLIKDFLTESEISLLICAAKDCIRKNAIVTLLAYSGIRNVELCNLKVEDVDLGTNEIHVIGGKNRKDRLTNISAECTRVLIKYIAAFPRSGNDFLFTTLRKGNKFKSADLRKHIKILSQKANLQKRVYPHLLRHSLASNLLNRGANIILIKNQLGHVFIETTMIYVQSMSYREKSQYDYYKPAYM
jgi:site-specific recombinase XerD